MPERRASLRLPVKAKVHARLVGEIGGKGLSCAGWLQDVSLGGLRFIGRKALPLNAFVAMDIDFSHPAESCSLQGQVGWLCREREQRYVIGIFIREEAKERLLTWRRIPERRRLHA